MYLLAVESLLVWEVDQLKCNLPTLVLVRTSQKLWSDALVLPLSLPLAPPTLYLNISSSHHISMYSYLHSFRTRVTTVSKKKDEPHRVQRCGHIMSPIPLKQTMKWGP
jgi:hypothetical protein